MIQYFFTGTSDVKLNPYHPAFASFMSGISAKGYYRTYFLWTMPVLFMRDIKRPREVKEMLHQQVEKSENRLSRPL